MATTAARRLGKLTDRQRAAKLARAAKLSREAADLLDELFRDRQDSAYRMDYRTRELHYGIGRVCTRAEEAATAVEGELADHLDAGVA